jgi:hypothetical protein
MAGRKPLRPAWDPFKSDIEPSSAMVEHAEDLFDEARRKEEKRHLVRPLDIRRILPDPRQPRRAIPYNIRANWDGSVDQLPDIFDEWRLLVELERQSPFNLRAYVMSEGDQTEADPGLLGPLESSLLALADLAANIRRYGLMNPVTVVRDGEDYQIETGERRWLAHHLLSIITGDANWQLISARVVDQSSVWRQAGENSARSDLNAIGKARQFALLLMDLYRQSDAPSKGAILDYDACVPPGGCDRAYYVQIADADRFRIPRGKGDMLLNAMGLKGRAGFSRYRALLQLPDEIWQLGDDYNWSDDRLYLLATMEPHQALERAQQMKRRDEAGRHARLVLNQNNLSPESIPVPEPVLTSSTALESSEFKRRTLRIARMLDRIDRLDRKKRREALDEIRSVRRWLDEAERVFRDETNR